MLPVGSAYRAKGFRILYPGLQCCPVSEGTDISLSQTINQSQVSLWCQKEAQPSRKSLGAERSGTTSPTGQSARCTIESEVTRLIFQARVGDRVRDSL